MSEELAGGLTRITPAELDTARRIAPHYRKWTGSAVAEMTQGEKDVVDAARVQARKTQTESEFDTDERFKALVKATYWLVNRIHDGTATTQAEYVTKIKSEVQSG